MNLILGIPLTNIRIVIGKIEVYPNATLIGMADQDICIIKIKTRILGGMRHADASHLGEKTIDW